MHKLFLLSRIILHVKSKVQKGPIMRYWLKKKKTKPVNMSMLLTLSSCDFNWWKYQLFLVWFSNSKWYLTLKEKYLSREVSLIIGQKFIKYWATAAPYSPSEPYQDITQNIFLWHSQEKVLWLEDFLIVCTVSYPYLPLHRRTLVLYRYPQNAAQVTSGKVTPTPTSG